MAGGRRAVSLLIFHCAGCEEGSGQPSCQLPGALPLPLPGSLPVPVQREADERDDAPPPLLGDTHQVHEASETTATCQAAPSWVEQPSHRLLPTCVHFLLSVETLLESQVLKKSCSYLVKLVLFLWQVEWNALLN